MSKIHEILNEYWGYDQFRPLQEDIINRVLDGQDTLALLPTGGGKSLCYQVPAMAMDGLCLVISPLIALMKDQVEGLNKRGITAMAMFSGMSRKELHQALQLVSSSDCKFLYVSPERLETQLFQEYLPGFNVSLIAVDEAHCISQWGYDFRPPYLRIAELRKELAGVPVLALTASATEMVQQDIMRRLLTGEQAMQLRLSEAGQMEGPPAALSAPDTSLGLQIPPGWQIFRQSFERPNLSYSVFRVDARINKILGILNSVPGTGIVYCKSRKRTQELSDLIRLHGVSADFYHAGLSQEERSQKQEDWINNKIRVIVCTNAFGMGIDKPDVRVVIHVDTPDCLENYYQEAGRGGRDGKKSYAVLLHGAEDLDELRESVAIRFPEPGFLKEVYQAVSNFLQVPAGGGAFTYFDFDMGDFLRKFNFEGRAALFALKLLEQEGWMSFNEQVFLPSTIRFNITKEYLYQYEDDHPNHEPIIKILLRGYAGIYDFPVFVEEFAVARLMRADLADVKRLLTELDQARVIVYEPRKDKPQLRFLRNRVKTAEMQFDLVSIAKRKAIYVERLEKMISFLQEDDACRSRMIGEYFGDKQMKECGICDNCLKRKSKPLTPGEFNRIREDVEREMATGLNEPVLLFARLKQHPKQKIIEVIEFLVSEGKLSYDGSGRLKNA